MDLTIRDDGATKTVIVHDDDGNEVGELEVDKVPHGVRVNGYQVLPAPIVGTSLHVGTLILRNS